VSERRTGNREFIWSGLTLGWSSNIANLLAKDKFKFPKLASNVTNKKKIKRKKNRVAMHEALSRHKYM